MGHARLIDEVVEHLAKFWPSMRAAAVEITQGSAEAEISDVPDAALKGGLKEMQRALRRHAKSTGCSLKGLTQRHQKVVFKLASVPSGYMVNIDQRHKALSQSFSQGS